MKQLLKKVMSMVLVTIFTFNLTGVCYAQETQAFEKVYSSEEMKDYIESVEGCEKIEIDEKDVSVEDAVEEVFYTEEVSEDDMTERKVTEYKDTKYITEVYEENKVTYVKTYSEDMLQMSVISYDGETINSDNYVYNAEKGEYEKQCVEVVCGDATAEKSKNVWAQAISYASKTKSAKWKDTTYWYQKGNNGKKTYLKIGCKATYRIRTDNLSDAKEKKCDAYISAVKVSRTYEKKALAYASAAGVSGTVIIALVLANATFPPATIVTIVFSILGGGATIHNAINYTIDSFEKWQDAKDYYNTIKSYGTKI